MNIKILHICNYIIITYIILIQCIMIKYTINSDDYNCFVIIIIV